MRKWKSGVVALAVGAATLAPTAAFAANTSYVYWGPLSWAGGDSKGNLHNEDNRNAYHGSYYRRTLGAGGDAYMVVEFRHWSGSTFLGADYRETAKTGSTSGYAWGVVRSPLRSNGTDVTAWTRMCTDKSYQVDPCSTTVLRPKMYY